MSINHVAVYVWTAGISIRMFAINLMQKSNISEAAEMIRKSERKWQTQFRKQNISNSSSIAEPK